MHQGACALELAACHCRACGAPEHAHDRRAVRQQAWAADGRKRATVRRQQLAAHLSAQMLCTHLSHHLHPLFHTLSHCGRGTGHSEGACSVLTTYTMMPALLQRAARRG